MIERIDEYYKNEKEKQELAVRLIKRYGKPKNKAVAIRVKNVFEKIENTKKIFLDTIYSKYIKQSNDEK